MISDQHFPYQHPDTVEFLRYLKKKYKPDRVINIGDELDYHAISFHEHNPDLLSPSDELQTALRRMAPLFRLFPKMDILESNHGSLVYRKGVAFGLPRHVFKSYRDILGAPQGWQWHDHLVLTMSDGKDVYFCHGRTRDAQKNSKNQSMSFIQGHHHSSFEIKYWANERDLYWGMTVGCLVDRSSLAYAYGKTCNDKPIIGCAMILDGHPRLEPMVLDKSGRWIGRKK